MATKNMVVLFDESGTPTIKDDPRTDWFLGVGVAYEQPAEEMIFARCKDACGLANSRPLKNDRIENARALCIAKLLADLPVSIFVSRVNTADLKYREIIVEYEDFGNKARQEFRQVRERSIAQIIHNERKSSLSVLKVGDLRSGLGGSLKASPDRLAHGRAQGCDSVRGMDFGWVV